MQALVLHLLSRNVNQCDISFVFTFVLPMGSVPKALLIFVRITQMNTLHVLKVILREVLVKD